MVSPLSKALWMSLYKRMASEASADRSSKAEMRIESTNKTTFLKWYGSSSYALNESNVVGLARLPIKTQKNFHCLGYLQSVYDVGDGSSEEGGCLGGAKENFLKCC